jgi:hypothetical protein
MAEDGIGITGAICLLVGGIVGGKMLSRWESKLDRHVVCEELDRYIDGLEANVSTADQHRELLEIKRGVDQVRRGNIPFDDGPGFLSSLWDKSKSLGSKVLWRGGSSESNGKSEAPAPTVAIKTPGAAPSPS